MKQCLKYKPRRFKESYGIACCRFNMQTKKPEVLMIKKKYTYAFFDFVFCKYKKRDEHRLRKLFEQMSLQEKADILKLDFDKLWCRIRVKIPDPSNYTNSKNSFIKKNNDAWNTYINKKNKFNHNFINNDKGRRLKKLINRTKSIDYIWEIPKGRPQLNEKPINTAVREFYEETDIGIDKYTFLLHTKPIIESYVVNRCQYKHTYFIAVANKFNWDPELNFSSHEQSLEVENIQWVSLDKAIYLNLKYAEPKVRIMSLLKKVITVFKHHYSFSNIINTK